MPSLYHSLCSRVDECENKICLALTSDNLLPTLCQRGSDFADTIIDVHGLLAYDKATCAAFGIACFVLTGFLYSAGISSHLLLTMKSVRKGILKYSPLYAW